jgi:hypothetical protein
MIARYRFKFFARRFAVALLLMALWADAGAAVRKESQNPLDALSFRRGELRVTADYADSETLCGLLPNGAEIGAFKAENGANWSFLVDRKTGQPALVDGGAIPLLPGVANTLPWEDFSPGCRNIRCLPKAQVAARVLQFVRRYQASLMVEPDQLVLKKNGSGPMGESVYIVQFAWVVGGVPVQGAGVAVIINSGNIVQIGIEGIFATNMETAPAISAQAAWECLRGYLSPYASDQDEAVDSGTLVILPATPKVSGQGALKNTRGAGIEYRLAYHLSFRSARWDGFWEAYVDARTGEVLSFQDGIRYGRAHGGVYLQDRPSNEADLPLAYADTGNPAPGAFADGAGKFAGNTAKSTLAGRYAKVTDHCGALANTTSNGDLDFGTGGGSDCDVPSPNPGGPGNTHAARTAYYHTTLMNAKARSYDPTNEWLKDGYTTLIVNKKDSAGCTGGANYEDQSIGLASGTDSCWNMGELPGIISHEWSHLLDFTYRGGGGLFPEEGAADIGAVLAGHDSCIARGMSRGAPCGEEDYLCTSCDGVRDLDYAKHVNPVHATPTTLSPLCSYMPPGIGPCGLPDHCEGMIPAQAVWDLATSDLPSLCGLDAASSWQLADRLWYLSLPAMVNMYICSNQESGWVSNGCGPGSLYSLMRAVDDDGDGTANGTPHAAAIFAALNRHAIACGTDFDLENRNQSTCPELLPPYVQATVGPGSIDLAWQEIEGAKHYNVYRSEAGCGASFIRVGRVDAPAVSFSNFEVAKGIQYYYRVEAVTDTDSCASALSWCKPVTLSATPVITGVEFKLRVENGAVVCKLILTGRGFHPGCVVRINGQDAPKSICQSESEVVAKGGAKLKKMLPKHREVQLTVYNPDDGQTSAPWPFTRP